MAGKKHNKKDKATENHPSRTKEDEAVITLLKAVDHINQITTSTMEHFDVTPHQYNILRILRGVGCDGLPTLELADRMVVRSPGVTRLLDRLEKKGLVTRVRSKEDRRVVHCVITPKGLDRLEEMDQPVAEMNKQIVKNLDRQQLNDLIDLLHQMKE